MAAQRRAVKPSADLPSAIATATVQPMDPLKSPRQTVPKPGMRATTVRFGADLWRELEAEAARVGVSVAQYVRDAALIRVTWERLRAEPDDYAAAAGLVGEPSEAAPPEARPADVSPACGRRAEPCGRRPSRRSVGASRWWLVASARPGAASNDARGTGTRDRADPGVDTPVRGPRPGATVAPP